MQQHEHECEKREAERVGCERNRDPSRTPTVFVCDHAGFVINKYSLGAGLLPEVERRMQLHEHEDDDGPDDDHPLAEGPVPPLPLCLLLLYYSQA